MNMQMKYGKIVTDIQDLNHARKQMEEEVAANVAQLPNVEFLAREVTEMIHKAEELEVAAREARQRADHKLDELSAARDLEKETSIKKEDVIRMCRDLLALRAQLHIDDPL